MSRYGLGDGVPDVGPTGPVSEDDQDRADTDPLPNLSSFPGLDWGAPPAAAPYRPIERASAAADPFAFPVAASGRTRRRRNQLVVAGAAGLVAVALLVTLAVWLFGGSDDTSASQASSETSSAPARDQAAEKRLLAGLPPGYSAQACRAVEPTKGALAQVDCQANTDPGGPPTASYTLLPNRAALVSAFDAAIPASAIVNCPGNIQSPGPWRRNASPQVVAGTLVCGVDQNTAVLAWTDEARLVLSSIRSAPPGPGLDQLYAWWSMHS